MRFLRLLLLPLATAGLMVGCGGGDNNDNTDGGATFSLFTPVTEQQIPLPFDLFFADADSPSGLTSDTTLNFPNPDPDGPDGPAAPNPVLTALNLLDGWSTSSVIFTDFIGADIDLDSANQGGVLLISSTSGALTPGVDYEVARSAVVTGRPRLLIRPLHPLTPGTTYIVILTGALRTTTGTPIIRARQFEIVSNPNPVGSDANPAPEFDAQQQAQLEQIRTVLIRPIFDGVIHPNPNIDGDKVLLAWSFTTQSISDSLAFLNGAAPSVRPAIAVNDTGMSSGDLGNPMDTVDIFSGTVDLASFLETAASPQDPAPLTTFWASDPAQQAAGDSTLPNPAGGLLPCAFFARSVSTTHCYPQPLLRSTQTVPVIVTVPNANSGREMPAHGWPVAIYQHGITRNRADVLVTAPFLAQAGLVTVAIDLPLHGIEPYDPASALRIPGIERTFDVDFGATTVGADGSCDQDAGVLGGAVPDPDGTPDCSGAYFNNPRSPATGRDNLRQAVADLIQLTSTLRVDGSEASGANDIPIMNAQEGEPASINLDDDNIQFVGHSLGGIVGGTFLGVNGAVNAGVLANPGGGITGLLDGSVAFGPVLRAGLASVAAEGTTDFENFVLFAQTVLDSGDPINYAEAANAAHPLDVIEIVGGANDGNNPADLVVPNFVVRNVGPPSVCPGPDSAAFMPSLDAVCNDRVLSGTDPLVNVMGLDMLTIDPPYTAPATQPSADTVIRFTGGHHGSYVTPTTAGTPGVTAADAFSTFCAMQSQVSGFLGQAAMGVSEDSLIIPVGATDCSPPAAP